nr:hypothetical protein [Prevotella sp.]
MKKLLLCAFALLAGLTANAAETTTIWEGEEPYTFDESWGGSFTVDKSYFVDLKAGDKIIFTCSPIEAVNWTYGAQVHMKTQRAGWASLSTIAVSAEGDYSVEVSSMDIEIVENVYEEGVQTGTQTVTTTMLDELVNYGLVVQGIDAAVSKIAIESTDEPVVIDPNAVWHGNADIGWNANITVPSSKFENAKVGDQIVVKFSSFVTDNQMIIYNDWGAQLPGSVKGMLFEGDESFVVNITTAGLAALKEKGMFLAGAGVTVTDILLVEGEAGPADAIWFGSAKYGTTNWYEFYLPTDLGENNYVQFVVTGTPSWKNFLKSDWSSAGVSPASETISNGVTTYLYKVEDIQEYLSDFIFQLGGEVTLTSITPIYMEPIVCVDLDPAKATDGWGEREYNTTTFEGELTGEGSAIGWWLQKDYSDFDKVYVELSAINIPDHKVEGETQPGYLQLFVQSDKGDETTSDQTQAFG